MTDETNQLLTAVLSRLEEMQAENKANFAQVDQNFAQIKISRKSINDLTGLNKRLRKQIKESSGSNSASRSFSSGLKRLKIK